MTSSHLWNVDHPFDHAIREAVLEGATMRMEWSEKNNQWELVITHLGETWAVFGSHTPSASAALRDLACTLEAKP